MRWTVSTRMGELMPASLIHRRTTPCSGVIGAIRSTPSRADTATTGPETFRSRREDEQHLLVGQPRHIDAAAVGRREVQGDVGATRAQHGHDVRIGGTDRRDRDFGVARVERT